MFYLTRASHTTSEGRTPDRLWLENTPNCYRGGRRISRRRISRRRRRRTTTTTTTRVASLNFTR